MFTIVNFNHYFGLLKHFHGKSLPTIFVVFSEVHQKIIFSASRIVGNRLKKTRSILDTAQYPRTVQKVLRSSDPDSSPQPFDGTKWFFPGSHKTLQKFLHSIELVFKRPFTRSKRFFNRSDVFKKIPRSIEILEKVLRSIEQIAETPNEISFRNVCKVLQKTFPNKRTMM